MKTKKKTRKNEGDGKELISCIFSSEGPEGT